MKILENELFKSESRCQSETPEAQNYQISFADDCPQNFLNNLESLQKLVQLIRKKVEDYNNESKQLFSNLPTQVIHFVVNESYRLIRVVILNSCFSCLFYINFLREGNNRRSKDGGKFV